MSHHEIMKYKANFSDRESLLLLFSSDTRENFATSLEITVISA